MQIQAILFGIVLVLLIWQGWRVPVMFVGFHKSHEGQNAVLFVAYSLLWGIVAIVGMTYWFVKL